MGNNVLLFCGAFDPITAGHMLILDLCIRSTFFQEFRVMPSGKRVDKVYKTSDDHRENMCVIAIDVFKEKYASLNISFCDYEMKIEQPKDSYFTVKHFTDSEPGNTFYFFLGSDILRSMFDWSYSRELVQIANFLIVYREGYEIDPRLLDRLKSYKLLDKLLEDAGVSTQSSDVSSTKARSQLGDGKKCGNFLLHPKVMDYVESNKLYDYSPDNST